MIFDVLKGLINYFSKIRVRHEKFPFNKFFFLTSNCCNNFSYYFDVSEYWAWKGLQCCVVYNVSRLWRFISFSDKFRRFTESGSANHKVSIFWIGINREIQREREPEIERVVLLLFNKFFFLRKAHAHQFSSWTKVEVKLRANVTNSNSRLQITTSKRGTIWLDQVSVLPSDTFKVRFIICVL